MSAALSDERIFVIASALTGADIQLLTRLTGGRNSRVFRVDTAGTTYALKLYPPRTSGSRDRLEVELAVLRWMEANGFAMVPRVLAVDRSRDALLLSWAEGDQLHDAIGESDIAQACEFLARLHALRATPALPPEYLAAEACLSVGEIERQLRARIVALRRLAEPALQSFLDNDAEPALAVRLAHARACIAALGGNVFAELAPAYRSQVPSDFGFHNALRRRDGQLTFIDFDYFGWDDPIKLVADTLLHPGTSLDDAARRRLRDGLLEIYREERFFAARLDALLPLFALRWAMILLNEFHPDRWRRRLLVGTSETWAAIKQRQLAAARAMLDIHASAEGL
jgi:Ser/Thr protein kinase RdoA (MazF antagonist)